MECRRDCDCGSGIDGASLEMEIGDGSGWESVASVVGGESVRAADSRREFTGMG